MKGTSFSFSVINSADHTRDLPFCARLSALLTELVLQRFMCLSMLQIMIKGKSLSVASDNLDIPSFARASTSSTLFIFLYL